MWFLAAALAAPTYGLGASIGAHTPTPVARGAVLPSAFVEIRPAPSFAAQLEGGLAIHRLGRNNRQASLGPAYLEKSDRRAFATAMAVFTPMQGTIASSKTTTLALDLGAGFGVVKTLDDLEALQAVDDPSAIATERQLHPSLNWSVGPRVGLGRGWDARARLKGAHWVETVESINLDRRTQLDLGLAVARTF